MPLQATSGAASQDAYGGNGAAVVANYIEDVFSTYLYTGNGSTQTITNGIDLSTKGGLVWVKSRSGAASSSNHILQDTVRGANKQLRSNTTGAEGSDAVNWAFNSSGFSMNTSISYLNDSSTNYVSWTFREQPKFFDIVTYTGDGANRTIAHNLGSVPGCIIIKRTDAIEDWNVYHRSLANTQYMILSGTAAALTGTTRWNSTTPTGTVFSLGTSTVVNASGGTYIAYIFAHDAGGFGLTGADNVISCGTFTTDGSGNATVSLGYEPQWVLFKNSAAAGSWRIYDSMRGVATGGNDAVLFANLSAAEDSGSDAIDLTSTGFLIKGQTASNAHIYIAIRRGPMKVPTTGTKVFSPTAANNAQGTVNTTGFPVDMQIMNIRSGYGANGVLSTRLLDVSSNTTSSGRYLRTPSTSAESASSDITQYWDNTGFQTSSNWAGSGMIYWSFGRAPSCMDVVCYTGTGVATTVSHNLQAVPELMIVKCRNTAAQFWATYSATTGSNKFLQLNATDAAATLSSVWNNTTPTSSVFTVGTRDETNGSTFTYVAYLFATCAGVSKVGSYTGTGATQTVACGFGASGARFVLVKRTDTTGDWYVWDSARGMVSGTDPSLLLNSTAAEVNANSVYAISTGFQIVSTAAGINASGGTYIFLAFA